MSQNDPPLVGSVIERKPTSNSVTKVFIPTKTGFPAVQHRSKSAFARSIEGLRKAGTSRSRDVPIVVPSRTAPSPETADAGDWRNQMSRENEERVASMTEEERERERQEILDRFGEGVGDLLRKVKLAREQQAKSIQGPTGTTQGPKSVFEPG